MIVSSEAIVLKSMKFRDTSKIVTLYTKSFGKISVLAKGARGGKSKFGSSLEPMSYVQAVFYKKEHRDLHLLSQADHIEVFREIGSDQLKLSLGWCLIEVLHASMHEEEKNEDVFSLTVSALRSLNATQHNPASILLCYFLRLCSQFGFQWDVERCSSCSALTLAKLLDKPPFLFDLESGVLFCANCSRGLVGVRISSEDVSMVIALLKGDVFEAQHVQMGASSALRLLHLIIEYIRKHVSGMKKIKSYQMVDVFLRDAE